MKRWSSEKEDRVEVPDIDAFMADFEQLCLKHKLSLSHEDGQGGFLIHSYNARDQAWVSAASDDRKPKRRRR